MSHGIATGSGIECRFLFLRSRRSILSIRSTPHQHDKRYVILFPVANCAFTVAVASTSKQFSSAVGRVHAIKMYTKLLVIRNVKRLQSNAITASNTKRTFSSSQVATSFKMKWTRNRIESKNNAKAKKYILKLFIWPAIGLFGCCSFTIRSTICFRFSFLFCNRKSRKKSVRPDIVLLLLWLSFLISDCIKQNTIFFNFYIVFIAIVYVCVCSVPYVCLLFRLYNTIFSFGIFFHFTMATFRKYFSLRLRSSCRPGRLGLDRLRRRRLYFNIYNRHILILCAFSDVGTLEE